MDKEKLQHTLNTTKNLKEIAKEFNISITTVRYWISKHEIKKENTCLENCLVCAKKCKKLYCSLTCKKKDYYENNKEYLKTISKEYCKNNREIFKKLAINYGGSKCKYCGYNNNYSALAFHHRIESEKEFNIDARVCNGYKYERLLKEIAKCDLLCHNCHSETHNPLCTL